MWRAAVPTGRLTAVAFLMVRLRESLWLSVDRRSQSLRRCSAEYPGCVVPVFLS
jgi:hypothetical protein